MAGSPFAPSSSSAIPDCAELARLLPDYALDGTIGTGATSVVKKARHVRTGQLVAIKIISIRDKLSEYLVKKEIRLLNMLDSPRVIRLYDVLYTEDYACLVLEYAPNGDFLTYLTSRNLMSEAEARPYFLQLISGVEYLHQKMVAHRDLKLENLLIDGNFNLKISDFGLSAIMNNSYLLRQNCGSLQYAAPETLCAGLFLDKLRIMELLTEFIPAFLISNEPYYGTQVDAWSCGIILYAIVCGSFPFKDLDRDGLNKKIMSGQIEFPDMYLSAEFRDLVTGMLTVCPLNRMTIFEIRQHPWLLA
ncbi:SNF1-related protein kinase catalytic subunit alpha KIN10-like [Chenopodium quinoa]|uniref:SNF1-related protein kinase catalytic subunit alpha KIN10-like n=1 Tax=Chenopodium quinoa TaxID=63459 RepID=UPI000B78DE14|nr:SNF1-related protein kinase catalytic subunit alpha KIN10-like [Chenopodium quinoa]